MDACVVGRRAQASFSVIGWFACFSLSRHKIKGAVKAIFQVTFLLLLKGRPLVNYHHHNTIHMVVHCPYRLPPAYPSDPPLHNKWKRMEGWDGNQS